MTLRLRPQRSEPWFRDVDGRWTTTKHEDESRIYVIDLSDVLAPGETIGQATWELNGPAKVTESSTTTAATIKITGVGTGVLTVYTSIDRCLIEKFRWASIGADKAAVDTRPPGGGGSF